MDSNSNSAELSKAIADYKAKAMQGGSTDKSTKVNRSKLIENSKQKFYQNLGMQYKQGEAPVEPSKRATSGSKGREGTKKQQ